MFTARCLPKQPTAKQQACAPMSQKPRKTNGKGDSCRGTSRPCQGCRCTEKPFDPVKTWPSETESKSRDDWRFTEALAKTEDAKGGKLCPARLGAEITELAGELGRTGIAPPAIAKKMKNGGNDSYPLLANTALLLGCLSSTKSFQADFCRALT